MKRNVFYPFLVLAVLVLIVGMACGVSVNTTEAPNQADDNPAPGNTAVIPTATVATSGPGPGSPTATSVPPGPGPAPAGGLDFSLAPNYGEVSLNAGFTPDPFEQAMTSGGSVDASYLGSGCNGFATSAPDFRLRWTGTSSRLRIMFMATEATRDTTIIVNAADGSWRCNDDTGGLNPMVELANPTAGTYDIWVGSYSSGTFVPGTLRITELDLMPNASAPDPGSSTGTLNFSLAPTFGERTLNAGFTPDPFEQAITSGGTVNVSYLGSGCTGFATSAPDFRLRWTGTSSRLRIMFIASTAGQDTTLIVNTPTATWACNDDYNGLNPMVEFTSPAAGQYDIWIGSYSSGQYISGTLKITELNITP
jgi:serine protease Do